MTDTAEKKTYRNVQGLSRGLAVLSALNRHANARASVRELADSTGLHRTTVRRLLETLIEDGFVQRADSDDCYFPHWRVRQLSAGAVEARWVAAIAAPAMGELMKMVVWPSDLLTLDGNEMVVRESTRRFSALSFERSKVGQRVPLLASAAGRAYLAHCSRRERTLLMPMALKADDVAVGLRNNAALADQMLERTRAQGFAVSDGEWTARAHVSALSKPIFHRQQLIGCLSVVYLKRALTVAQAQKQLLVPLQRTVLRIEEALDVFDEV